MQDVDFVNTLPESIKHKDPRNQDPEEGFKNLGRLDKKTKIMCPKKSSAWSASDFFVEILPFMILFV